QQRRAAVVDDLLETWRAKGVLRQIEARGDAVVGPDEAFQVPADLRNDIDAARRFVHRQHALRDEADGQVGAAVRLGVARVDPEIPRIADVRAAVDLETLEAAGPVAAGRRIHVEVTSRCAGQALRSELDVLESAAIARD